jgi:hypothetical protein
MQLSEEQFNQLIKDLTSDSISLEWEGTEAHKEIEGHEMKSGRFLVFADFNISAYATYDAGDYYTPPSFDINSSSVDVNSIDAFVNDDSEEDGEEITFTEEQYKKLFEIIENLIEIE